MVDALTIRRGRMGDVYVVGTLDTKGDEHRYVRDLIEAAGASTKLVDVGTTGKGEGADVTAGRFQAAKFSQI